MKFKFYLFLYFILVISCGERVNLKEAAKETLRDELRGGPVSTYQLDGKGGLFKNIKWYSYNSLNHIIYPLHDIFYIKKGSKVFQIQIRSFYNSKTSEPGYFTLAVKREDASREVTLEAQACGTPYTNPDFQICQQDPNRNIYTYLDLESLKVFKITDEEARKSLKWDIAFKVTDIKLNAGKSGPGSVVGAFAQRIDFFYHSNGSANFEALSDKTQKEKAAKVFDEHNLNSKIGFYLPDGIDRVVHETLWFETTSSGERFVNDKNWWVLKTHSEVNFAKFHFKEIEDTFVENGNISTNVTLNYFYQSKNDDEFSFEKEELSLSFSTRKKRQSICLDFIEKKATQCKRGMKNWDIKLNISNKFISNSWKRDWKIFINKGALGPLSKGESDQITSGKEYE